MPRTRSHSPTFSSPGSTPRHSVDGAEAWFTPAHNAYIEHLFRFAPGQVLLLYQTHLVPEAQRVIREFQDSRNAPPPGGALRRRNAFRVAPTAGRRRVVRRENVGLGISVEGEAVTGFDGENELPVDLRVVPARRPVPSRSGAGTVAVAGERVQRGRVGDAPAVVGDGVASRTRSRSVRSASGRGGL